MLLNHGDVLVRPDPAACTEAALQSNERLSRVSIPFAGRTLGEWRGIIRKGLLGADDVPVIVTGHQPEWIHSGVWAKHIVGSRLAEALGGCAVHLVVDSDVAKDSGLRVPTVREGRVEVSRLSIPSSSRGVVYEQIPALGSEEIAAAENTVRIVMEEAYEPTQLPTFFGGIKSACPASNWVHQVTAGRRAIEAAFQITVQDQCVSQLPWTVMLVDALLRPQRFVEAYNHSLDRYRQARRIRGSGRPVPNLTVEGEHLELPVWALPIRGARRRVFVRRRRDAAELYVESRSIGVFTEKELQERPDVISNSEILGDWQFRPRALLLTAWARLFLADLFIHGIGGAQYDVITDAFITDYLGIAPPPFACISATLHLDLPRHQETTLKLDRLKRRLRDLQWNPQQFVLPNRSTQAASLLQRRIAAINRSDLLRRVERHDRRARGDSFREIHALNSALAAMLLDEAHSTEVEMAACLDEQEQHRLATDREYFFGLFPRHSLERLLEALPAATRFRL